MNFGKEKEREIRTCSQFWEIISFTSIMEAILENKQMCFIETKIKVVRKSSTINVLRFAYAIDACSVGGLLFLFVSGECASN